jgi:hypothetical protein
LGVVQEVGFVDDHHWSAAAFDMFGGQGIGGLRGQGGGVETGDPPNALTV